MVLKIELCCFSGAKIYPGRGIKFIHSDSQLGLGFPVHKFQVQEVLLQPLQAVQDHMDCHVQKAAQEVGLCSRICEEEAPCH